MLVRRGIRRALVHLTALALVVGSLAGCAAAGSGSAGGGGVGVGSSQVSGATETFDSPSLEPTAPDTSDQPAGKTNPAISVARLPIGGDSQDDDSDAGLQCAHVTWIASRNGQIPRGTAVEITRAVFDPAAFRAVGGGCGSVRPSCLDYIFRSSALQCDLAVRATGQVSPDASPSLAFAGLVFCPDNESAACRRFVAALAKEQQLSVSLNVPQLPATTTEGPPTTDTSSDTATTDGG